MSRLQFLRQVDAIALILYMSETGYIKITKEKDIIIANWAESLQPI